MYWRGIFQDDRNRNCIFWVLKDNDLNHLFFSCLMSLKIWVSIITEIDSHINQQVEGLDHLRWFHNILKGRVPEKKILIWFSTCWSIWPMRNNIFFRGDITDAREEIINTKVLAWTWYIIGIESRGCSKFYYWNKAPLMYLNLNWSLFLLVKYLQCSTNPIAYWKILFFFFFLSF